MDKLIEDRLKAIERRQDQLQTTLDLLFKDRSLLEDILTRLSQVEKGLSLSRETQIEANRDLRTDIAQAQFKTEDKVDEVKKTIDEKTVIVKSPTENVFQKIKNMLLRVKAVKV